MRTLTMLATGAGAASLLLKVTLLLAVGALIAGLLRRASASSRHFVWSVTLASTVVLACLAPAVPSLVVRIPESAGVLIGARPNHAMSTSVANIDRRETRAINTAPDFHTTGASRNNDERSTTNKIATSDDAREPRHARRTSDGGGTRDIRATNKTTAAERVGIAQRIRSIANWIGQHAAPLAALTWIAGFMLVLMWCVSGHIGMAHLISNSIVVSDATWTGTIKQLTLQSGRRRKVRLLMSEELSSPVTTGWLRPAILLPTDLNEWSDARRAVVLAHELAHIERADYLTQVIASVACSLFWFHPAIWLATARLRAESERAADDCVLDGGVPAVQYATHLLALADHSGRFEHTAASAIGMAGSSQLEGRLRAMLDSNRSRRHLSQRAQRVVGSVSLMALVPVASLRMEVSTAPPGQKIVLNSISDAVAARATATPGALRENRPSHPPTGNETVQQRRVTLTARTDSTVEQSLPASDGELLTLNLSTGGSLVVRAWDEPRVRLHAALGGESWRETRVEFDRESGGIRLRSDFVSSSRIRSTSHRFELWVPRRTNIELSSSGGDVTIRDVDGTLRGHTGGGNIDLSGVHGVAALSTGGGNISVRSSQLSGVVTTGGGEVRMTDVQGGLHGLSGTGEIYGSGEGRNSTMVRGGTSFFPDTVIRNPDGSLQSISGKISIVREGTVNISKSGGTISVVEAPRGGTLYTGGGMVSVGSSSGLTTIVTGGGDVELLHMGGDADIATGAGDIFVRIVNTDGRAHTMIAKSGSGHVTLEIPDDLDAQVDLETGYTESYLQKTGRAATINSDFTFTRYLSSTFVGTGGMTPRKFVRGSATFGAGHGHIEVYTVNGDITVRRVSR